MWLKPGQRAVGHSAGMKLLNLGRCRIALQCIPVYCYSEKRTNGYDSKYCGHNVTELATTVFTLVFHSAAIAVMREEWTGRWREHTTGRALFNLQLKLAPADMYVVSYC